MISQASTQPQTVSTETASPQTLQANLLPFLTACFFVVVAFFAGAVFFVFVAIGITPFTQVSLLEFPLRVRGGGLAIPFVKCMNAQFSQNQLMSKSINKLEPEILSLRFVFNLCLEQVFESKKHVLILILDLRP